LALEGFRPVPEIQFSGFFYEVMDSMNGQMARMRYRSGGTHISPITIRSPFGGGVQTPEMHADSLEGLDRKSTRLNSSHVSISYAVFCLKKKKLKKQPVTQL